MSNRRNAFQNSNPNPSTKWLEWKGEKKGFEYYDKEKEQKTLIPLPLRFLTLQEMHTVKGWDDSSQSGITANEVSYIGTEPLSVRSFKGGDIAEGLYKDIKLRVKDHGGYYVKSVYIMTEDGEICNISLKGSAVQEWGEFTKKTRRRLPDEWVSVSDFEERKKGATTYYVPVFKFDKSLSNDEAKKADLAYDTLEEYLKSYTNKSQKKQEVGANIEMHKAVSPENLPPVSNYDTDFDPDLGF